ncbi:MAG TPA: TVP38/TMEM64 family protein [Candidatus Paceibacterota bacterium]
MQTNGKWQRLKQATFLLFVLLVITSLTFYFIFRENLSIDDLRLIIQGFGIWAPLIFMLLFSLGTIFIPSTPFMLAAGILFGLKYGFLYSMIAGLLSAIAVFSISRKLGKEWAENILQKNYMKKFEEYNKRLEKGATYDLIILRFLPIMPFNMLNIMMGISRISARDYVLGTIIGLIPSNIITVYAGTIVAKIF